MQDSRELGIQKGKAHSCPGGISIVDCRSGDKTKICKG